jgi:hypothetical protein
MQRQLKKPWVVRTFCPHIHVFTPAPFRKAAGDRPLSLFDSLESGVATMGFREKEEEEEEKEKRARLRSFACLPVPLK